MPSAPRSTVRAAGCVVWRYGSDELEVLVVHRPRYDDWSFPKGKVQSRERLIATAVREVEEETGLRVRLGPRMRDDHYTISSGQPKVVSYWAAQPPRQADITRFQPNDEIDQVAWLSLTRARLMLTQARDVQLLNELEASAYDSSVLLLVRHSDARRRKTWRGGEDLERPLTAAGRRDAADLVPVFAAYGITRVLTSDAVRCVDTMLPFVNAYNVKLRFLRGLSEERSTRKRLAKVADEALGSRKRTAICTHRPVLPDLCAALGIEHSHLEPGAMLVIHRADGRVLAVEKPE